MAAVKSSISELATPEKDARLAVGEMLVHLVDLPVRSVREHGIGSFSRALNVIVELRAEGGLTGWGEACPWPAFTGTAEAAAAALDHYIRPLVIGEDAFAVSRLMARLDQALVGSTEAKAAMETALLDLKARALGVDTLALQADVGDLAQARALVESAADRFGAVDILVNNASIWQKTPLPMGDFGDWHRVLGVLLDGSMYLADAVAPAMLDRGEGAIVNILDLSTINLS